MAFFGESSAEASAAPKARPAAVVACEMAKWVGAQRKQLTGKSKAA